VWVASAALVGCASPQGDGHTRGELGRVKFSYQRSCFFGCPLDQPLLVGTRESIRLTGRGNEGGVVPESSDKAIAIFALERACYCERRDASKVRIEIADDAGCEAAFRKACENTVLVEAKSEGDARLTLKARDGITIDRATLEVRKAARGLLRATFPDRLGSIETTDLALHTGETVALEVELFDAEGRKLLAPEGVVWRVDDAKVATVSGFLVGPSGEIRAGLDANVQGVAAGTAKLTVVVPGSDATLALLVR
jgi:hypothetical protein